MRPKKAKKAWQGKGSATLFMERLRARRTEMRLVLKPDMATFVHFALNSPGSFNQFGTMQVRSFTSDDFNVVKQMARIKKWFREHVLMKEDAKAPDEDAKFRLPKKEVAVGIPQGYADILKTLLEHYKPAGHTAEWCEAYAPLMCQLKGEKFVEEDIWLDPDEEARKEKEAEDKRAAEEKEKAEKRAAEKAAKEAEKK